MNTRWIRRLLWMAGFACLWLKVYDDPPLATSPYLLDVTPRSATLALITPEAVEVAGTVSDAAGAPVAELREAGPRRRHEFVVGGLSPATSYHYELRIGAGRVERGRLRTAPLEDAAPVRFVFLGDSGDQPPWVWLQRMPVLHWPARWGWLPDSRAVTDIGAAVAGYAPDFVLHLGDIVYPRGYHAHYRSGFFRPFGEVMRHAPLYAVLGNHDVMDAGGVQALANLRSRAAAAAGDGRNFSFAWGPLRVIGLDCNSDYTGDRFQAGHPSHTFLLGELASCTEPWIVVASHFPMRSASRQRDRAELLLGLLPELAKERVSLYLSGHDHCYQRFAPDEGEPPLVVSGGGGKDLYDVRPHPRAVALASQFHFCSVETRGAELVVRAQGLDGAALDEFRLPLPAGEALERVRSTHPERARRIEALRR